MNEGWCFIDDRSLPPTLHITNPDSISNCSKAPRGLSVLLQVTGIFTGSAISPSPSLRQLPSRYAVRAGQNLPDEEFRYHRTVIVTAAVHSGLSSSLPQHFEYKVLQFSNFQFSVFSKFSVSNFQTLRLRIESLIIH